MSNKILIICNHINGYGGAQKEIIDIANMLDEKNEVSILTIRKSVKPYYQLNSTIKASGLNYTDKKLRIPLQNDIGKIAIIISEVKSKKPDFILSVTTHCNLLSLAANYIVRKKIIIYEVNEIFKDTTPKRFSLLVKLMYGSADVISANSKSILKTVSPYTRSASLRFIPKAYNLPEIHKTSYSISKGETINFIAIGRISYQKAYDVLLKGLSIYNNYNSQWTLHVLGDGPDLEEIKKLSSTLKICDKILWHGVKKNFKEYLCNADVFVLPSRYEGVPNVLVDAMGCQMPIVVSSVPGSLEYASDKDNALVFKINDHKELADKLVEITDSEQLRQKLAINARKLAIAMDKIKPAMMWEKTLSEMHN